jgi:hypothetical protein
MYSSPPITGNSRYLLLHHCSQGGFSGIFNSETLVDRVLTLIYQCNLDIVISHQVLTK